MAMTDERRRELRAMCEAATPGPWFVNRRTGDVCSGDPDDDRDNYPRDDPADLELMAASRTSVPELLDEVDRLRAEVAEYRGKFNQAQQELLILRGMR